MQLVNVKNLDNAIIQNQVIIHENDENMHEVANCKYRQ